MTHTDLVAPTRASVLLADLRGAQLSGVLRQDPEIDLRQQPLPFDRSRFEKTAAAFARTLTSNEVTLAPRAMAVNSGSVHLQLGPSTYSAYRAASALFSELDESARFTALLEEPAWDYSHSLGVNLTLETADGLLVSTTRRPKSTLGGGLMSVAMSEGAHDGDLNAKGHWSPKTTALRGLHEELGLAEGDLLVGDDGETISFHSLIAQTDSAGIAALGHARTALTADDVREQQQNAIDGWEAGTIVTCSMHLDAIERLASSAMWVSWAPAAMFGLVRERWSDDAASYVVRSMRSPMSQLA